MKMELTGNEMILSFEDLWSIVGDYVIYLRSHNQTSKLQKLIDSMHLPEEYYGIGLEPMFELMSKHGMPRQFPADGSHFNETAAPFQCPPSDTSSFEVSLIQNTEYW
jgi:hypothetical protein